MPRRVSDVMTPAPQALPLDATLYEAARVMRDEGIGDVLVTYAGQLCGMVTDRDIVVRAVAESRDTSLTPLGEVCTAELCTVHPEDDTETAARLMIEQSRHSLDAVAREAGFRDRRHMREAFIRGFGVPPQAVRRDARRIELDQPASTAEQG